MEPADLTLEVLDVDPHGAIAELRAARPVTWVPALDGWLVTGRDLAVTVMRDADTFTVDDPRFSTGQVVGPSMLSLDGAEHARHRSPFVDALRPSEVAAAYGARIEAASFELVRSIQQLGSADLRAAVAGPLAVGVAAEVLGLDTIDRHALLSLYRSIVAAVDDVSRGLAIPADGAKAFEQLSHAIRQASSHPSTLIAAAAATLAADEVVSNSAVFLFGGIETSEGMTANTLHHLLANPDQWSLVLDDPALIDNAVEESLRLEPAASRVDRYATADIVVAGQRIGAGDLVVVSLSGANRDPAVFERADRFDVRRHNARQHVAFAAGPHACIGAQLARLQTRAVVRAVAELLPGVRLESSDTPRGVIFRKPPAVHVVWD